MREQIDLLGRRTQESIEALARGDHSAVATLGGEGRWAAVDQRARGARMKHRQVIRLEEPVHDQLPVEAIAQPDAALLDVSVETEVRELAVERTEMRTDVDLRCGFGARPDQTVALLDGHRNQAALRAVEAGERRALRDCA